MGAGGSPEDDQYVGYVGSVRAEPDHKVEGLSSGEFPRSLSLVVERSQQESQEWQPRHEWQSCTDGCVRDYL